MNRYHDMEYFNKQPIKIGISLINKAIEKREEQRAWGMWISKYPYMTKDSFVPFSQFYNQQTHTHTVSKRSTEDILREAEDIREKLEKK